MTIKDKKSEEILLTATEKQFTPLSTEVSPQQARIIMKQVALKAAAETKRVVKKS